MMSKSVGQFIEEKGYTETVGSELITILQEYDVWKELGIQKIKLSESIEQLKLATAELKLRVDKADIQEEGEGVGL